MTYTSSIQKVGRIVTIELSYSLINSCFISVTLKKGGVKHHLPFKTLEKHTPNNISVISKLFLKGSSPTDLNNSILVVLTQRQKSKRKVL